MPQKSITDFVFRAYRHGALDTERALQRVRQRAGLDAAAPSSQQQQASLSASIIAGRNSHASLRRWAVAASVAVLMVLGGIYAYSHRTVSIVAQAAQLRHHLPDGSTVTLAPHAALSYNAHSPRQLSMRGKAYFDVVHRADEPFTVSTRTTTTTVLGTRFMVSEEQGRTRLFVTQGLVGFAPTTDRSNDNRSTSAGWLRVSQGHGATVADGASRASLDTAADINTTAWATGELRFHDTPLSDVLRTLSDLYGHRYTCSDTTHRLTATFSTESETAILEMIEQTMGVSINAEQ